MTVPRSPVASSSAVRAVMQANRKRDTKPEVRLRSELHRRGLRYRVDASPLEGLRRKADLVFPRLRVAVFVDGCFWHRCADHGTSPRSNSWYWEAKLDRNVARDQETNAALLAAGWHPVRVWEHENEKVAADKVCMALDARRNQDQ